MSSGFYKRRRGIIEHLEAGNIGLVDLAVHDYLCLKMNAVVGNRCSIPAGVCFTSSAAIYAVCSKEISERTIRRSLEHLEKIGWIKRWTVRGKHGNYPVMVARASVHDLSGKEYRVSTAQTSDWRFPFYIPCEESASSARAGGEEMSADRELKNLEVRGENKAVRRTANDAELRALPPRQIQTKRKTIGENLQKKIGGMTFQGWVAYCRQKKLELPWDGEEAWQFIGYRPDLNSPLLSADFMITLEDVYDELLNKDISPRNFCSRVIDRCRQNQEQDPNGKYYWPPDFQMYRDRLREAERMVEHKALAAVGA